MKTKNYRMKNIVLNKVIKITPKSSYLENSQNTISNFCIISDYPDKELGKIQQDPAVVKKDARSKI